MGDSEDFTQLPLPDQFAHKNWKARKGGYETATKDFKVAQPSDPVLREFILDTGLWKAAVADSNVAAQQEALHAYNAFLDAAGPEGAKKSRNSTVQPIIEKGLTGRPAAKAAAMESLLLLIELDKADPVVEEILPLLSAKTPKVIVAALSALTATFHAYGCKTVEPKPVLKQLPKMYGHADKNVRAESQNLTVELYRWLREAMKPLFWNELKEVQQKDLEKMFEPIKAEPTPQQERLLRSQQAAKEREAETAQDDDGAGEGGEEDEEDAGIDLEPEFEAVDPFKKIPKDFDERLASTKWKDRKDALDETLAAVNHPALQEGPYDNVMRGLAKSMKDANIAVVTVAANCVECIAKGLRKSFGRYKSTIFMPMLERFKEKKTSVTDAIAAACDAVVAATGLPDVEGEILEALQNKNPQVKEQSAKLLVRCLKATREAPTIDSTKAFAGVGTKLLTESAANLRDIGAETLGVLWKIMGDRNMLPHLEGLDDIRKAKVKEFSDAAEVRAKWKPKAAPPPKAAPAATKKPAAGTKKPAGAKKPAAPVRAPSPPADDAPLAPRPTSKPATKPGLKPPGAKSGLQRPGLKTPSASSAGASSPKRQGMVLDDPPPAATPKSGLSAPGRGLAGRPLGKPTAAPGSPPPAPREEAPVSSISSAERQELSDLRQEIELVRQQSSDLRNEKMKLTSQVAELQNMNAQLIEDHTRDVLQIKAKETQLVRARSDAENAEDRANSQSKEIERLKREISRLSRTHGGDNSMETTPGYGAANGEALAHRPAYGSGRSYNPSVAGTPRQQPTRMSSEYGNGSMEGKENYESEDKFAGDMAPPSYPSRGGSQSRPMSNGSSGRATPASNGEGDAMSASNGSAGAERPGSTLGRSQSEGVESWRRAAEVTQNLKARIEMMKARQNMGNRGQ
ncbi:hypothetical protein MBLNU230_g4587t1 [Neophaeotheca triangularis]